MHYQCIGISLMHCSSLVHMSGYKFAPLMYFGHVSGVLRKIANLLLLVDAFNVVWHNSLLRKLYSLGLPPACWNIMKDSYAEMSSVVNWEGELSKPFLERKGERQDGIISPAA